VIFKETPLKGSYIIEPELREDERGFFARTFCRSEFIAQGLDPDLVQCNISYNQRKGTLRGMHFQAEPWGEAKSVRCTNGKIYDVILDLRPDSPTYCRWTAFELSAKNHLALFIPKGFAHGFQTLEDNSEVFYQMSEFFKPEYARGVRWNDPTFSIDWPLGDPIMSDKDKSYGDYRP
jgi:dTDP-4-dehydrorhamnose 3,5-epimerase